MKCSLPGNSRNAVAAVINGTSTEYSQAPLKTLLRAAFTRITISSGISGDDDVLPRVSTSPITSICILFQPPTVIQEKSSPRDDA